MSVPDYVLRVTATQATLDRFLGKTYKLSTVDCGRMLGLHLRKLGRKVEVPKIGAYSTYPGALKWLKQRNCDSLEAYLDALGLLRISPASALVGDILTLGSSELLSAPVIYVGDGRYLGFHEDSACCELLKPTEFALAWRAV
ncbi:DUF6950 family protein [Caulobacter sp. DWR3-1-2]|uniref:DUF6950 family protein n=1 Tax=Caulobacter sp. DWR3-1-2 TaxID=2804647 RepID=UPI003CE7906C